MASKMNNRAFRNQMLFGICDGLSSLVMSATLGYTSSSLILMYKDSNFEITEEQGNWIGSIIPGMALIGSLVSNIILESIGRKRSMLLASILSILTWVLVGYSSNIYHVLLARLCAGFFLGLQQVAVSVYVSETIHPKLRPLMGIFPAVAGALGFLIINVIPESIASWRGVALIGAALSIPLPLLVIGLSETPYYLLKNGNRENALKCLISLRETREEAENEFKGLEENTSRSSKRTKDKIDYGILFSPPNRWPVVIAILLHLFQPLTGFVTLCTFMGLILERAGSLVDSNVTSFVSTVVNIASVVFMSKLPSKFGRRTLLKWSSQIIIGAHICLSFYLLMRERGSPLSNYLTIIPFLSFLAYGVGFCLAWGPIPWMFIGDGLPIKIRGDVASLIIAVNWGFTFIVSKTFSWGASYFGYSALVAFYAVCTFIAMTVMQDHCPETFGFSPKQIDNYYIDSYKLNKKKE